MGMFLVYNRLVRHHVWTIELAEYGAAKAPIAQSNYTCRLINKHDSAGLDDNY